jgi:hypothetical protein
MISYLMVGTNDLPRAIKYFDALMEDMGASKVYDSATSSAWGWGVGTPMFIVSIPFDRKAATVPWCRLVSRARAGWTAFT